MWIKWVIKDFYNKVLMGKQMLFLELKVFYFNVKTVVTVETLKNQIKRKTQMILFFKEKKFNNGYMILFNNDFLEIQSFISIFKFRQNIYKLYLNINDD